MGPTPNKTPVHLLKVGLYLDEWNSDRYVIDIANGPFTLKYAHKHLILASELIHL